MKNTYIILVILAISTIAECAKIKKKSIKTTGDSSQSTTSPPAIIAIEIVDPNENSTSKQSKRTIESALGYGYNSFDRPKYEVYKYSQHDIPPFKGDPTQFFKSSEPVSIQKSVQYTLPPVAEDLKPGTTLYSSLSSQGQIGGLTSSLSNINGLDHNDNPVPVIVLRIYPDQLKDSSIQANLPNSHPFAKTINSINIQSLLEHYIKALQPQQQTYEPPQNNYYPETNSYQSSQYYPNNNVEVQPAPVKYQFNYQTSQKKVASKKPQFFYVQTTQPPTYQNYESSEDYYQPRNQYYSQQYQNQDQYQQQYDDYYQPQQQQYSDTSKLLTAENYPSDKHTRIAYKTKTEIPSKDVKTIKIQIPENVAKVEVQETEKPYYDYQDQPVGSYSQPQPDLQPQDNYYLRQDSIKQQQYYHPKDSSEDSRYDYQNVDYDQDKYFVRRNVLPQYYYQEYDDKVETTTIKALKKVTIATTTQPSTTSKPKSKRRT